MVEISNSPVVVTLFSQRLDQASGVASISRGHAIADLLPQILPTLATAAGAKQVVVELVVAGSVGTIKDGRGSSLVTVSPARTPEPFEIWQAVQPG